MLKNINLEKVLKAMAIAFSFIFVTNIMNGVANIFSQNFLISFLIYSVLCHVALYGYELSKILGLILFLSISLLSPNLYPNFKGELFPITYVVFALFLSYIIGIGMYKKWKTSL
tara:strand:- start:2745 stop:3086 length:342 start_codon:yes stop_codon:yes gene_type:complete